MNHKHEVASSKELNMTQQKPNREKQ